MKTRSVAALVVLVTFATGCGDDVGGAADAGTADAPVPSFDAGTDAGDPADAGPLSKSACPDSYGPATIIWSFKVGDGTVGFDLDGDDDSGDLELDNVIGASDGVRSVLDNNFSTALDNGTLRLIAEFRELEAIGTDDSDLRIMFVGGLDNDEPADLSDDFDGDEDYYFEHAYVDPVDCEPKGQAAAAYAAGVVTAKADRTSFFVSSFGGFLDLARVVLELPVATDTRGYRTPEGATAVMGAAVLSCSLAKGSAPLGASAQHALVQYFSIQPDIDLDGDGLETVESDSIGIISCTDGDGTVIMGGLCGCDARIADGYSIAFQMQSRGANILGPLPAE